MLPYLVTTIYCPNRHLISRSRTLLNIRVKIHLVIKVVTCIDKDSLWVFLPISIVSLVLWPIEITAMITWSGTWDLINKLIIMISFITLENSAGFRIHLWWHLCQNEDILCCYTSPFVIHSSFRSNCSLI